MTITPWQVPLLVMAAMIVAELGYERLRRSKSLRTQLKFRTGGLAVLAALVSVIGIIALGPSLADQLASVAAAIAGMAALWLTYQSYRNLQATVGTAAPPPAAPPPGVASVGEASVGEVQVVEVTPIAPSTVQPVVRGGAETVLTRPRRPRWRRRGGG